MDSMEYRLSKFKNDIANQFGHNLFYNTMSSYEDELGVKFIIIIIINTHIWYFIVDDNVLSSLDWYPRLLLRPITFLSSKIIYISYNI